MARSSRNTRKASADRQQTVDLSTHAPAHTETTIVEQLEQRIAERTAALEASEQRIRAILDAAVDAIITIDIYGTIHLFSVGAQRMFGYTADEACGQNVCILMSAPYRHEHDSYLRRYLQTRAPRMIGRPRELRARHKNGSEFPIQLSVSEIEQPNMFVGIIRDMSEQRELQNEIVRIASSEQRRIGQELHDNTQQELIGLGLLAEELRETLERKGDGPVASLAARLAAGIAESTTHVRALARGLVPVPVDAAGLISALNRLAQNTKNDHSLDCAFECSAPVAPVDNNAARHIFRIAQEAVNNAVRHAKASHLAIHLEGSDNAVTLRVSDNGIGIPPNAQDSGGLGLRIMEHRCGLIGGTFSVEPLKSGGTAVVCRIPKPWGAS